jgi:hypothetical protein
MEDEIGAAAIEGNLKAGALDVTIAESEPLT